MKGTWCTWADCSEVPEFLTICGYTKLNPGLLCKIGNGRLIFKENKEEIHSVQGDQLLGINWQEINGVHVLSIT
jgi:hypothetical protein